MFINDDFYYVIMQHPFYIASGFILFILVWIGWMLRSGIQATNKAREELARKLNATDTGYLNGCFAKTTDGRALWISSGEDKADSKKNKE